ncbi:hypothetical protein [Erythrobacter phage vB_EliS-L02]|nr:hypothetical protein [Erythrobacter phage vB_EliS-L02]
MMPRYSVIVTRDTTESAVVEIEASNGTEAEHKAAAFASDNPHLDWKRDYTPNADEMVYTNGADLIE